MRSTIPARATHKIYRLQIAIHEMEEQVRTNPSKKFALEELKRSLEAWTKIKN